MEIRRSKSVIRLKQGWIFHLDYTVLEKINFYISDDIAFSVLLKPDQKKAIYFGVITLNEVIITF
jgi:hypothetical protein